MSDKLDLLFGEQKETGSKTVCKDKLVLTETDEEVSENGQEMG